MQYEIYCTPLDQSERQHILFFLASDKCIYVLVICYTFCPVCHFYVIYAFADGLLKKFPESVSILHCIIWVFYRANVLIRTINHSDTKYANKKIIVELQWILSSSTTLYLEHIFILNYFPGPLNISTKYTLILSLYRTSISNKNFGPVVTIFSLSRTFYLTELVAKVQ